MANLQPTTQRGNSNSFFSKWVLMRYFTRQERSWILYDCANSAYSAIVSATILPLFFTLLTDRAGISTSDSTAYWGYATSLGFLICAVLAPLLGALGDFPGYKKRLFTFFMAVGVLGTALLAFTSNWLLLLAFYVISNLGFSASCLFYDSFLSEVTDASRMDLVSSFGFGTGYITGSTIPLLIAIGLLLGGEAIGVSPEAAMRFSFLLTAVWWGLLTIPMLRHVKQKHSVPREGGVLSQSMRNIASTFRLIVRDRGLLWFLIAYFFYIDGVGTIIHLATKFGESKGIAGNSLIMVLMAVQLVAFPCAIAYGFLAKKVGIRKMILLGIGTYLVVCLVGLNLETLTDFILLGALVGTAQGGLQALSRSYFGKLVPKERSSEYFGFFDIFGKFSSVLGPLLFGLFAQMTGRTEAGVIPVAAMFLIGGLIFLFLVPKEQEAAAR